MSVSTRSLGDALAAIAGADAVVADPTLVLDGVRPRWHVAPGTVDQLAAVVGFARDAGLTVCPMGSGSTLELGAPLERVDIALDVRRLDAVLEDTPDDLTISLQAGVTLETIRARLSARRQMLPIDPPGDGSRTIGGIAATHAQGPLRAKYRTVRDLLLGIRFVQADGVLTWGGARVVKSVTGYDIPKLMVGSMGTLGVLAELTLRLQPMPDVTRTWIARFSGIGPAGDYLARVLDSVIQPSRVEWLNAETQRATRLADDPLSGDGGAVAVAVSIGSVEEAVQAEGAMLTAFAGAAGGRIATVPETVWDAYAGALAGASRRVWLKLTTLPAHVAEVAGAVDAIHPGAVVAGCAALGVLRVGVTGGPTTEALAKLVETLRGTVGSHGGSVVVERGPRELRARVDAWGPVEPGALALMRALKDRFDPTGVLNPGRFVGGI